MIYYNSNQASGKIYGASKMNKIMYGKTQIYPDYIKPDTSFKWKATYSDGHTNSRECDVPTIGQGEIPMNGIVSVNIGDCVTEIGQKAFQTFISAVSINVPNTVTSIGNYAFNNCESLTGITIPYGVQKIGKECFRGCHSLQSVDIPGSVVRIDNYGFQGCSSLTSVTFNTGIAVIAAFAFSGDTSLTSIVLPDSMTYIDTMAFRSCTGLTSVTIEATTPPTLANSSAFNNTNNCPIYVPASSVDAYKTARNWSTLADRIQAIQ